VRVFPVGQFTFTGSQFGKDPAGTKAPVSNGPMSMKWSDFHFQFWSGDASTPNQYRVLFPIQGDKEKDELVHEKDASVKYPSDETDRKSWITYDKKNKPHPEVFYHSFVDDMLSSVGSTDNLDDLFGYFSPPISGQPKWKHLDVDMKDDAYGALQNAPETYNELNRPYAPYNWELGFHAPMAIVDRLLQNQQFDAALKMIHYVFDPLAAGPGPVVQRVWQWLPFRETDPIKAIENIFDNLRPNTADVPNGQINQWRDHAFQPHGSAQQLT
jgi:hypothetical protein